MPITHIADRYLQTYHDKEPFPPGLAYQELLDNHCKLDFSIDSLKRIDLLLDQIREGQRFQQYMQNKNQGIFGWLKKKKQFTLESFMDSQANEVFLMLLAFYFGKTMAINFEVPYEWFSYKEYVEQQPQHSVMWPDQF